MTPRSASVPPLPVCIAMMVTIILGRHHLLVGQRLFHLEGARGERARCDLRCRLGLMRSAATAARAQFSFAKEAPNVPDCENNSTAD